MAEAVLKHQITQRTTLLQKMDIKVDSAGTGAYHAGDDADSRTIETCRRVSLIMYLSERLIIADVASTKFQSHVQPVK
jgi:low molecular weight phosphotyrosine protein phosphatase